MNGIWFGAYAGIWWGTDTAEPVESLFSGGGLAPARRRRRERDEDDLMDLMPLIMGIINARHR